MVARITSGATPVEALYYNKDKIGRGEGRFLAAFNTPMQVSDERYFDIREALHCFDPYLEANRRTKNPVFHASLNPVPEDRLTNDELRQIASAKIPLSRMISPQLYWVMTGNDFTLDINNSEDPKILCVGNNPDRQDIYSAALGLYNSRIVRLINKKGKLKSSIIIDELLTIYLLLMIQLLIIKW